MKFSNLSLKEGRGRKRRRKRYVYYMYVLYILVYDLYLDRYYVQLIVNIFLFWVEVD